MRKLIELLKSHFFAGLFILIPISVSAWVLLELLGMLWQLKDLLPEQWNPEALFPQPLLGTLFNILLTIAATLALATLISIFGWASKHFLGRKLIELIEHVIQRIPVIRSLYSALDQLLRTIANGGGKQFSRVVYVEYPRKGIWTLAFVTSTTPPDWHRPSHDNPSNEKFLSIYVPTTPNPTSGFYLLVSESEVRNAKMKVEEAFKVILSLGIAHAHTPPQEHGGTSYGRSIQ